MHEKIASAANEAIKNANFNALGGGAGQSPTAVPTSHAMPS